MFALLSRSIADTSRRKSLWMDGAFIAPPARGRNRSEVGVALREKGVAAL
jgi:hypothetical protein